MGRRESEKLTGSESKLNDTMRYCFGAYLEEFGGINATGGNQAMEKRLPV